MSYSSNIATSLATKFAASFITLGVSIISARELGSEKFGEISLIVLAVAITMIVGGLLGGPNLIYFTPRKKIIYLLIPAYINSVICAVIVPIVLGAFHLFNIDFLFYVCLISFTQGLFNAHMYILLGLEKLNAYNFISIIQSVIIISSLSIYIYIMELNQIDGFLLSLIFSFTICFLLTIPFVHQKKYSDEKSGYSNTMKDMIVYGFIMQVAGIFQQLNYRLTYYIIHSQLGDAKLGIFALTMQIAEGVLLISRSVSMVLFSKLSNLSIVESITDKTNTTLKFSYSSTFFFLLFLLILPASFYEFIFSKDFSETKIILWYIAPGIMFLAIQTVLSSYFGSVGKIRVNALGSFVGLVVISIIVWPLMLIFDLTGGAIANVISYFSSLMVALIFYVRIEKMPFSSMLITKKDIEKYLKAFKFKK